MTLQTSGAISLANIQTEFGGAGSISLTEYYAGGIYVPAGTLNSSMAAIPSGGAISIGNFYGGENTFVFNYAVAASAYASNLNVLNDSIAAGFPNSASGLRLRANIVINGVLGSNSTALYAFDTGTGWAKSPIINVTVNSGGYISGAGGNSGGAAGGNAMLLQTNILLGNYGIIQAGGGAGAGGYNGIHGGGAGANAYGSLTSNFTGIAATIIYGGRGYQAYPAQSQGDEWGTLESGGFYQDDAGSSGRPNGGSGGGWIVRLGRGGVPTGSAGWGTDRNNNAKGGGPPGYAIINQNYLLSGSIIGTIRERINDPAGTYLTQYCSGVDLYGTYANGSGGTYDALIEANSASCQLPDPNPGGA